MKLDDRQIEQYSRQIILPELGGAGQRRLLDARCLLAGAGPAFDTAATYLAGAGVGAIALVPLEPGAPDTPPPAFAPLSERSGDTRLSVTPLAARESLALGSFDVALFAFDADGAGDCPLLAACQGEARRGSILVSPAAEGGLQIILAPAGTPGCVACTVAIADERAADAVAGGVPPARRTEDAAAASGQPAADACFAGAMAALAACRWITDLARDVEARALHLAPGSPAWVEVGIVRRLPCPRGCHP